MRATLKDIAEKANVSIKTVSNVVNNNDGRVSPATRDRVLAAIAELDYRPNLAARQLRQAKVGIIAVAVPDIGNPYFAGFVEHVVAAAKDAGYVAMIDHTDGDRDSEMTIVKGLRRDLIDGIIFNPLALDEHDIAWPASATPVVLIGERLIHAPFDHVLIDNAAAARAATGHLLAIGRRRIAAIGLVAAPHFAAPRLRLEGYLAALDSAGVAVDDTLLLSRPDRAFSRGEGMAAMFDLLALPNPPDAVFCFNDLIALGAMRAAWERGVHIPDDIAIIGIDDIEDGRFSTPTLTTIAPDMGRLTQLAVRLLVDRIEGKQTEPPSTHFVPFDLIVRESTVGRQAGQVP